MNMNKNTYIRWLIALLILVNTVFIAMYCYHQFANSKHRNHKGPRNYIISKLNFNKEQTAQYDKLIEWHRAQIRKDESAIMDLKKALYTTLNNPNVNTAQQDSIITEINLLQNNIEHTNYTHFKDIKALCTPEQLVAFSQLCTELSDLFTPHPPKLPHK